MSESVEVWFVHYPDLSGLWIYREEIEALRWAVERGAQVKSLTLDAGGFDVLKVLGH